MTLRGSIELHFQKIKSQVLRIASQIRKFCRILPLRHIFQLWRIFIKPHFDNIWPVFLEQRQNKIEEARKKGLIRNNHTDNVIDGRYDRWNKLKFWSLKNSLGLPVFFAHKHLSQFIDLGKPSWNIAQQMKRQKDRIVNFHSVWQDCDEQIGDAIYDRDLNHIVNTNRWNSYEIKRIPNVGYFDQRRYESFICNKHNVRWHLNHTLEHGEIGYKVYQTYQLVNAYVNNIHNKAANYLQEVVKIIKIKGKKVAEQFKTLVAENIDNFLPFKKKNNPGHQQRLTEAERDEEIEKNKDPMLFLALELLGIVQLQDWSPRIRDFQTQPGKKKGFTVVNYDPNPASAAQRRGDQLFHDQLDRERKELLEEMSKPRTLSPQIYTRALLQV